MGRPHHSDTQGLRVQNDGAVVRKMDKHYSCELCNETACVYCAADEAYLCLACDYKVHSANFLVNRHSRDVLCASCGALMLSALEGPRIDHPWRHCTQCAAVLSRGDDDVWSNESRNSSCCTESSNMDSGEVPPPATAFSCASKRQAIAFLEEGCGDSEEDPRHSCLPKRKRVTSPSRRHLIATAKSRHLKSPCDPDLFLIEKN